MVAPDRSKKIRQKQGGDARLNTFENELKTCNLVNLLSCREGVDEIVLGVEDEIDVLYLNDDTKLMHVEGPARILIVTD